MEKTLKKIIEKIDKGEEISPFLFLDKNIEILNEKIKNLALQILQNYNIPKEFFYIFEKNLDKKSDKIWVEEIKLFVEKANISTPFKVQIFFIENFWKITTQAWNSLLKIFEEPGKQNIFFLSNPSESGILDTILSRVQTINFSWISKNKKNEFYQDLIKNHLNWSLELTSYFFKTKLEKEDYLSFLENLIIFAKNNFVFIEFLDEILEDINAISQNNVNAKFIVDKWILRISHP